MVVVTIDGSRVLVDIPSKSSKHDYNEVSGTDNFALLRVIRNIREAFNM